MSDITTRQFLIIMYNQLSALKKEDEKYFNQAMLCIDLGLNPKDLRIDDQIAIQYTNDFMEDKKSTEKKNFHFMSKDILDTFENAKNDNELQTWALKEESRTENEFNREER